MLTLMAVVAIALSVCLMLQLQNVCIWSVQNGNMATFPNAAVSCKILGSRGGDYEECRLLGCVAVWLTVVSEERIASIIRVKRIGELGTMLAATSNRNTPSPSVASYC
jgi:hypothetical protein